MVDLLVADRAPRNIIPSGNAATRNAAADEGNSRRGLAKKALA